MSRPLCVLLAVALLLGLAASANAQYDGRIIIYNDTNRHAVFGGYKVYNTPDIVTLPVVHVPPRWVNPNPVEIGYLPYGRYRVWGYAGHNIPSRRVWVNGDEYLSFGRR